MALDLMYFHGNEAEEFRFYQIPKALFTDDHFQGLSTDAKLLYGLMLDRMGLSIRNNWLDEMQRVYIYFTLEEAMEMLRYGRNKAIRLFAELSQIGLIERRKQGQGKPSRIYVKNFILPQNPSEPAKPKPPAPADGQTSQKGKSALPPIQDVKTSFFGTSKLPEMGSQDLPKRDPNDTDMNNTNLSDTDPPSPFAPSPPRRRPGTDRRGRLEAYRTIIRENISYDILLRDYGGNAKLIDGCVDLMAETCSCTRETVRVNQENLPTDIVRSRLLELDMTHITYVQDVLSQIKTPVGNIRAYTLSVLYNAPMTMEQFYTAEVNRNLWRGG